MDPAGGVMIAYHYNGERLSPITAFQCADHPGWIGGRMVKWLKSVSVRETPSDNYHFYDNRIMPPHSTPSWPRQRAGGSSREPLQ